MLTNNEKLLIEALETMLDQSWDGPIDCDHFAREKAAAALEFVRQKVDPHAELRAKAEAGDAHAQWSLGFAYYLGEDVAKDPVEAMKWYRKAAEQGHGAAQLNLGYAYAKGEGEGVAKDQAESDRWYALAKATLQTTNQPQAIDPLADVRAKAAAGDAQAQYSLGYAYRFGDDVEKDLVEAVKWYRKAAEQGHARAQTTLGNAYSYGVWVKKDLTESAKWYQKAAEQEAGVTINK